MLCALLLVVRLAARTDQAPPPRDVEVLVVGTGPSGIMLSSALSGHWPYLVNDISSRANTMMEEMNNSACSADLCDGSSVSGAPKQENVDEDSIKLLAQHLLEAKSKQQHSKKWKYQLPPLFEHLDLLADGMIRKIPGPLAEICCAASERFS
jgi:hypothetical protein